MKKITVSDYIVQELSKLGVNDFFGLPGDYNFNILKSIEKNENTNWIGSTNELNAGYAADGYARIGGNAALVTTYGVGELSAINAVAGSYAENVPVFNIVGAPATKYINRNALMHHNLNAPDYYAFQKAYSNVVETTAFLNEENAKAEIDRVISVFIREKKPVYVAIPVDICKLEIENEPNIIHPKSDVGNLEQAVAHALRLIAQSKFPVILADVLTKRYEALDEMKKFMENSKIPISTLWMGKGIVNEDYEGFIGTYLGSSQNLLAYKYVNDSDCVISIGTIMSDLNTFGFDVKFAPSDYISVQGNFTIIENQKYENILMKDVLLRLAEEIEAREMKITQEKYGYNLAELGEEKRLTSDYIYPRLQEFFNPDDIIFCETGVVQFGLAPVKLPAEAMINSQSLWGSIGWATPAAFGAAMVDKSKRTILITGEGSHQLTAQAVSSMMRHGLNVVIIVLNNSGYTIERALSKDPLEPYNDIDQWDYTKLPSVFAGDFWAAKAKTEKELDEVLKQAQVEQKSKLCYIEIFTDKLDIPSLTKEVARRISKS